MSDDYMEIQRRNFEAQFGSLSSMGYEDKTAKVEESEEDEFSGFSGSSASDSDSSDSSEEQSDSDEEPQRKKTRPTTKEPEVVRLTDSFEPVMASRKDKKLARSGRAPTLAEMQEKERKLSKLTKKQQAEAAKEDSENLENDLKLQRLLSESHILAHNMEHSGADLTLQTLDYEAPIGNARRRILDQRIRAAAATNSSTNGQPKKLEKMPMHMRKGMISAREKRAAEYEREAREAGIVLSKVKKGELRNLDSGRGATVASDRLGTGKKKAQRVRDRGLRIHSVGKSTPHGLRISPEEIKRINSSGKRRR